MRMTFVLFLILITAPNGNAQQNCRDCGVAFFRSRHYNLELRVFADPNGAPDRKYIFYDSMVIAEQLGIYTNTDANNRETVEIKVCGYTFIDFRTKSFYNYANFSDTARIVLSLRQPAKGRVRGGWNFFDPPRAPDKSHPLPDTVVDGNRYHRLKGFFLKNGDTVYSETQYYVSEKERRWPIMEKRWPTVKRFPLFA